MLRDVFSSRFLRAVLWFDASTGYGLGALHLGVPALLSQVLGLPAALLQVSGVMLLGFALLATALARADRIPRGWLAVLVLGNACWALTSLGLLLGSALEPPFLGQAYLLVHVVSVAVLAAAQWAGLRRLRSSAAMA
ncbi:MAG: hypothetical protein HEQ37_08700 [Acidovorax sp.]|jgi:hypothetical protein|uniref:hypothetical protein n=1 Tax=Acidovorax sp. TaxID=1872122 RepID=UPI0025B8D2D3|nr:hypothetical protein [Acidovorax sp.]MCO4094079.1 hypothetical protein [Acidovorax sp.]MDH4446561.1 hypothetical protein [Acidovorax sp.]